MEISIETVAFLKQGGRGLVYLGEALKVTVAQNSFKLVWLAFGVT